MNPKRQKAKERRRARVLAEQAWEAANRGNLDLAEKIIRRAVSTQEDNPVLWNDQGVILGLRQKDSEAAKSFAAALSLAPTFADPYAHLAALRLRQGARNESAGLADPSRQVRSAEHIVRGATSGLSGSRRPVAAVCRFDGSGRRRPDRGRAVGTRETIGRNGWMHSTGTPWLIG